MFRLMEVKAWNLIKSVHQTLRSAVCHCLLRTVHNSLPTTLQVVMATDLTSHSPHLAESADLLFWLSAVYVHLSDIFFLIR